MTEAQADTRDTPVSHASRLLLILAARDGTLPVHYEPET
jgi:hypothetical protein